jgi:hypothetical protein
MTHMLFLGSVDFKLYEKIKNNPIMVINSG